MTRIDFYFNVEDRFRQLAELAGRALPKSRRLFVFVPDTAMAQRAEYALWTQAPTGFLPHCRGDHALAAETPIIVDWRADRLVHDDVLINLHPDFPPFFSRFKTLIEIVSGDELDRDRARERYRFYRDRGYEIHRHDLAGA